MPDAPQLNVVASHVEDRLTAVSKRQQGGHRASTLRALDAPPPDAAASAGLTTLATRFLTTPETASCMDAAIRLAQMARGGARADAAFYLGFGRAQVGNLSVRIRQWQRKDDNAQRYEEALSRLADLIAATPNLTNKTGTGYRRL
ncbi:hypothetical protein ACWEWX_08225 [Streptomyces asiaticus]